MKKLYLQTKAGFREIIHIDDAAKLLKIKPRTLSAYLTREQIFIKKIRIKNLIFFYREDIDTLLKLKSKPQKADQTVMVDLFNSNS